MAPEPVALRLIDEAAVPFTDRQPGDAWFAPWYHEGGGCPFWANCDDPRGHLLIMMPPGPSGERGWVFDTDCRARNCTMLADRQHRCWVKHGEPPALTLDKAGLTCGAGAGSIATGNGWHGFLRSGQLVTS